MCGGDYVEPFKGIRTPYVKGEFPTTGASQYNSLVLNIPSQYMSIPQKAKTPLGAYNFQQQPSSSYAPPQQAYNVNGAFSPDFLKNMQKYSTAIKDYYNQERISGRPPTESEIDLGSLIRNEFEILSARKKIIREQDLGISTETVYYTSHANN